jgi:hypothetical protein
MSVDRPLQRNNRTFLGRYWTEHSVLRRAIASDDNLSILSFGCSTGEELVTIRALFPRAHLFGCDLDWRNLQAARALTGASATVFHSSDKDVLRHGPYDVILCNSVLLAPTSVDHGRRRGIDPAVWIDVLSLLDSALNPGGFVQIINSNIPFRYHPVSASYCPFRSPLILGPNFVDQFDLDGRHLCTGISGAGWSSVLSRHLGEEAWQALSPTDFHDVHFQKHGGTQCVMAVEDECMPSLPNPGEGWASGTATYRPHLRPDPRPSTHVEVDVAWTALGVDLVRLERTTRRIWFDGSVVLTHHSEVDLSGASATSFIEAASGRRSTHLAMDDVFDARPVRSASY